MQQVCYVAPTAATTAIRAELGRLLQEVTPGNLSKAFFTNGGAEANENAVKIARMFTGRFERKVIPVAGHNLPQEVPGEFAAAILQLKSGSGR